MSTFFRILLFLSWASALQAQLPVSRTIQAAFDKGTRSLDGSPGKNYWQNGADYNIQVRFEPANRLISGTVDIVYTNNSPDTLKSILFKLYPNLYQKGVSRLRDIEPDDLTNGVQIKRIVQEGEELPANRSRINGTNMQLRSKALNPGQKTRFSVEYTYELNENSHNRTGQVDSGAWFIAYFFPRIAVYDDIDGWNQHPYLGSYEFYNDFCKFNLAVTVPKDFVVWATGDLLNCSEVLAPKYCQRLAAAEQEDALRFIIDSMDLKTDQITVQKPENTFRFSADHVSDVAFAVSDHYVWESGSLVVDPQTGRRTRVDAVFHPNHRDYYLVASDAWKTVEAMSFRFPKWPFPYAHMTVFDGLDQMEYPMMANDNPMEDRAESIELTDHEIFHTMFPFYMGTNETKYAWMDEGWATIGEWLISPMIDSTLVDEYGMAAYSQAAGTEQDIPIMTPTTQLSGISTFLNAYPKPAMGYLYVKDLLGDELFFKGLHHYIRSWNGKHPMPYDFFYSMNAGTGVDLNWFWKAWFFDDGFPDLALEKVQGKGRSKCITVKSTGTKPVPVDLTVVFEDGSQQQFHRNIAVWKNGVRRVEVKFRSAKKIKSVTLGSTYVPDVNMKDNVYSAPGE